MGRGSVRDGGKKLGGCSLTDKKRENGDFLRGGTFLYLYVRELGYTQNALTCRLGLELTAKMPQEIYPNSTCSYFFF